MRCAMAGNGGRRRRAHGACGRAMEAVISASPGIISAESEFHSRVAESKYRILLKTGELREWAGNVRASLGCTRRSLMPLGVASRRARAPGAGRRRERYLLS